MKIRSLTIGVLLLSIVLFQPINKNPYPMELNIVSDKSDNGNFTLEISTGSYTPHSPILIDEESDFGTLGFGGSGTENDPYIISGLNITSDVTCINITNIHSYFEITLCWIDSVSPYSFFGPDFGSGIYFENVTHGTVADNIIRDKDSGISVHSVNEISIQNNSVHHSFQAIYGLECNNTDVILNQVTTSIIGIGIITSENATISNSTIQSCSQASILLSGVSYNCICENNTILNHSGPTYNEAAVVLSVVLVLAGDGYGWIVSDNIITSANYGIAVEFSRDFKIENNALNDVSVGMRLWHSNDAHISDNDIFAFSSSIIVLESDSLTILENYFEGSSSLQVVYSNSIEISNNVFVNGGIELVASSISQTIHTIESNIVNGKPLYYSNADFNVNLSADIYGQIILTNADDVTIESGSIHNTSIGIQLIFCEGCEVREVELYHNVVAGISLYSSKDCYIEFNDIHHNGKFTWQHGGISVGVCFELMIFGNRIYNNSPNGIEFIYDTTNVTIRNNAVFNNTLYGIYLGVYTSTCQYNLIFGNAIGWNGEGNARDEGSENMWDDGISQGNSWSDFDPSVAAIYPIDGDANSVDNFPLTLYERNPYPPVGSGDSPLLLMILVGSAISVAVIILVVILKRRLRT
ncbi:MAG: hypothetical protein GF411_16890 [Candidatus Lokiarchaeota archaeon]|nr:hypothetical protein [Candidatus Lokiarchaeota archaeon]